MQPVTANGNFASKSRLSIQFKGLQLKNGYYARFQPTCPGLRESKTLVGKGRANEQSGLRADFAQKRAPGTALDSELLLTRNTRCCARSRDLSVFSR